MSTITTVGELRAIIADLPDDMPLTGHNDGSERKRNIEWWIEDPVGQKCDSSFKHPVKKPTLVLSTD